MAQSTIQSAMDDANLSKAGLADKMEVHRSQVTRMLSGSQNLTIKTMSRALAACGSEVRFQRVPIAWYWGALVVKPPQKALPAYAGSTMPVGDTMTGVVVPAY
ncbi:MAG: helix-turn-helix transcriptional regulator [Candidatus Acidiferrales bacterium]